MKVVEVSRGTSPLVMGFPHVGTFVPDSIFCRLSPVGKTLIDTDWHVDRLYEGLVDNITTVRATFHRYVIDANRDPDGSSLYPGQNTTGLVPETDFDGRPIWIDFPTASEIVERIERFHRPYHDAMQSEIRRVHALHGFVILYDCHSIRSEIPYLFEGTLPDLNIGTCGGLTCDRQIESFVTQVCQNAPCFSSVVNGRFKGGWTTRHYGKPNSGFHAIQMELAQKTYLKSESPPFDYESQKADQLRPILQAVLKGLLEFTSKLDSEHSL